MKILEILKKIELKKILELKYSVKKEKRKNAMENINSRIDQIEHTLKL